MVSQRIRIIAVLAVLVLLPLAYWNYLQSLPVVFPQNKNGFKSGTHDMVWKSHATKPLTDALIRPNFDDRAHNLSDANEFLPHFKAVLQMPHVSMSQAKETCQWPDISKVNFQFGDNADWVRHDRPDTELDARRKQWQDFVQNEMYPWEDYKDRFTGRGIVILTGNHGSIYRTKVTLGQLTRLKSKLPVEINFWGDGELNSTIRDEFLELYPNTFFNDLSGKHNALPTNHDNIYFVNYQMKSASIVNSRFAEILFLDSDNIPVIDPELLFDSETYKEYGTVFWPDIARTRPNNPIWAITNTPCKVNEYEAESGQMLVNKMKYWYHLQLSMWFNNVQGSYYNSFLLGDKDLFRFAWHALKTEYGRPAKWVTSVGTNVPSRSDDPNSEPYYCGHTFAQHHPAPNGPIAFLHGGLLKQIPLETLRWHISQRGGIYQAYKRISNDEDALATSAVAIKFDGGDYLPKRWRPIPPAELKLNFCTDYYDVPARNLTEVVPGDFQDTFLKLGGYWMIGFF